MVNLAFPRITLNGSIAFHHCLDRRLPHHRVLLLFFFTGDPNMWVEQIGNRLEGVEGDKHAHRAGDALNEDFEGQQHHPFVTHHHLHPVLVDSAVFEQRLQGNHLAPGALDIAKHMFNEPAQQGLIDIGQRMVA